MKRAGLVLPWLAAAIAVAAPAAAASSDYLLEIDGIDGAAPVSTKISNWSFGQSNPVPVRSGATGKSGKPNLGSSGQDGVTQQESHSASADARKNGAVVAADFNRRVAAGDLDGDGRLDFAEAGKLDQVGPLSVILPSAVGKALCASKQLRSGHIRGSDGSVYDLASVKAVCTGDDGANVTVSLTGSMRHKELTGHVTLIK